MTTHVDAPAVGSPDPDREPAEGSVGPAGSAQADTGSGWVQEEMRRRMAANRSTRGRHARHGLPVQDRPVLADPNGGGWGVPRHSAQHPPVPVAPPAPIAQPAAPIGVPSLPNGLRAGRRSGPGAPLHIDDPGAAAPAGQAPARPWDPPAVPRREPAIPLSGLPDRRPHPATVRTGPAPAVAPGDDTVPPPPGRTAPAPSPVPRMDAAALVAPSPVPRRGSREVAATPPGPPEVSATETTCEIRGGPAAFAAPSATPPTSPDPGSTRVRVVLSERRGAARPVRTIKEVEEGTPVGELLRRDLIRSQLFVALRYAGLTVLVLGALPVLFVLVPAIGRLDLHGVRVPWLLLGVLIYPFLVGVAWRFTRVSDRVEQTFADHVQD
jgi:hypothetical protein